MGERSEDFEQALRRLRAEYRAGLPGQLERLEAEVARARAAGTPEALRVARQQAHTLKGTSGSYGLDGISKAFEAAEQALEEILDGARDARAWQMLASALESARAQLSR